MARVLVLSADLLFGSRVQGELTATGDDVELVASGPRLDERLADATAAVPDVLVVDLTDERLDGSAIVRALLDDGRAGALRTLGFYSHVDVQAREQAEQAGFDLVVPRSRMAREGAALVAGLSG